MNGLEVEGRKHRCRKEVADVGMWLSVKVFRLCFKLPFLFFQLIPGGEYPLKYFSYWYF